MSTYRFDPIKPHGLGDAVALVAQPIAKVFGLNSQCGGCAKRKEYLNSLMPVFPRLIPRSK